MSSPEMIVGADGQMLPDKMTGRDLVAQEEHELGYERSLYNGMDLVDRRDKRNSIVSFTATRNYRTGYDLINWNK